MRFYFFFFIFLILSAGLISAATLSGSPSSLNFNLDVGEEKCMIFLVSSSDYSGDLTSIMKWAEKDAEVSSPNDFVLNSSEIELSVSYSPETISNFDGEEEIQVCISGAEEGYWKGSLEYRTESDGNIGVGVGTWLRVNITDVPDEEQEEEEQIPPSNPNPTNTGGSSSSSSKTKTTTVTENATTSEENTEVEEAPLGELEEESETSEQSFGITGAVIGTLGKGGTIFGIIFVIVIVAGGVIIYRRNSKK